MSPLGQRASSLHAGWPTANDEHLLEFFGTDECVLSFSSSGRVKGAGDLFHGEDSIKAALVTGSALSDLVIASLGCLLGPFRISQERPAHPYHVGLVVHQDLLGQEGIVDTVAGDHRDLDYLLDSLGQVNISTPGNVHGDQWQKGLMPSGGHIDQIDASFLEGPHNGLHFLLPVAALHEIITGGAVGNRETRADACPYLLDHFYGKPHPPLSISAVLIAARVGQRREELVHQVTGIAH